MDSFFELFNHAHLSQNGYQLSETLIPYSPSEDPDQLRTFYNSTNVASVKKEIEHALLYDKSTQYRLSTDEGRAWVEVYVAYWRAVGEVLKASDAERNKLPVRSSTTKIHICGRRCWVVGTMTTC